MADCSLFVITASRRLFVILLEAGDVTLGREHTVRDCADLIAVPLLEPSPSAAALSLPLGTSLC